MKNAIGHQKNCKLLSIIFLILSFFPLNLSASAATVGITENEGTKEKTEYKVYFPLYSRGFIALDNGYRWDKIRNRVTVGGPTASVKGSTQMLRNINSYQLGARGQWNFCNHAFIRGNGHYGWVFSGDYSEGGFFGNTKGHTYDFEAAVGYYFTLASGIAVAPVLGWSYDALNLKGTSITIALNGDVFHLSDIQAHQKFNGPFVGFDIAFQPNRCSEFTFGYEFHYAWWHGQRFIQGPEYGNPPFGWTTGYSNKRHINNVYGQVFRLDSAFKFCGCWTGGLELKYRFFNGDHGKYKQTKQPLLSQFTYATINGLWWHSFAATVYLGRAF